MDNLDLSEWKNFIKTLSIIELLETLKDLQKFYEDKPYREAILMEIKRRNEKISC